MRTPELKPAQIRALLALLVLVPLIPGVLMLRMTLTAIENEKALSRERSTAIYEGALASTRSALEARLPLASPESLRQFYQGAFGPEVAIAIVRDGRVVAGQRSASEPIARLAAGGVEVELSLPSAGRIDADGRDQIERFVWSAGASVAVALGIALLAALAVSRRIRLHEVENSALATVAHELKTPLASSRVLLETLAEGRLTDASVRHEYYDLLRQENLRLSRLVETFLVSGRLHDAPERGSILRPETVLEDALATIAAVRPNERARVTAQVAAGLPELRGDGGALATSLANLIENALKFSDGPVEVGVERAGSRVVFAVTDFGVGIPRGQQRRIFARFHQVDQKLSRASEGCGLGLSIVKEIVEAHRGRVRVRSQPGRGSTFTIALPAVS